MFSVTASPFNSPDRALYGGWAFSANARDAADSDALAALYADPENADDAYYDSKWANLALRYSGNAANRAMAKKIKAAIKGRMKDWRKVQAWADAYNLASAAVRSPFRKSPLKARQKANIWATFAAMNPANMTPQDKMWLSALNGAPYSSVPVMPQVSEAARALLSGGPYYDPAGVIGYRGDIIPLLMAQEAGGQPANKSGRSG